MEIVELYGVEAAATARGHVVVIDVLRAFTCAAYAFADGVSEIVLAGTIEEALALKAARPGSLLIGHGRRDEAHLFDVGNSPYALRQMGDRGELRGRTLIQRTGSGTQGVVAAKAAERVYLASLVNASATARHLRAVGAETVSLVAMGAPPGGVDGPEDVACRDLIAARLRRVEPDERAIREVVRACPAAAELRDPARGVGCSEDVKLALDVDCFWFAMEVRASEGALVARRVRVPVMPPSAATKLPFDLARIAARHRLGRISFRDDVNGVVDVLIAADRVTDELCELVGRAGTPTAEDFGLLDRALAAAGIAVDIETAAVVESLAVVRDLLDGRLTPTAARVAMPIPRDFGSSESALDLRPWTWIWCADSICGAGNEDDFVVDEARKILLAHGPTFGLA